MKYTIKEKLLFNQFVEKFCNGEYTIFYNKYVTGVKGDNSYTCRAEKASCDMSVSVDFGVEGDTIAVLGVIYTGDIEYELPYIEYGREKYLGTGQDVADVIKALVSNYAEYVLEHTDRIEATYLD